MVVVKLVYKWCPRCKQLSKENFIITTTFETFFECPNCHLKIPFLLTIGCPECSFVFKVPHDGNDFTVPEQCPLCNKTVPKMKWSIPSSIIFSEQMLSEEKS
jgi:hypothetical protein